MEEFNKIFVERKLFESLNDDSNHPMALGRSSKSYAVSMLNDEVEGSFSHYTKEDRFMEKNLLKKLSSKGNLQNDETVEPNSRRPGEFTEVDFPKVSSLTMKQMKFYHNLSINKKRSCLDSSGETQFEELNNILMKERMEYQEFARYRWTTKNYLRHSEIKPSVKNYIDDIWQSRINRLQKYPKHYISLKEMIPLNFNDVIDSENPVTIKMDDILFSTGEHNSFVVPPLIVHPREVTYLPTAYQTLTENRDPDYEFLPPVSRDPIVENLLTENAALKNDHTIVVLSGSSIKTVVDNNKSNLSLNWMLPVTVKEYKIDGNKTRKVIFIDKKLPPTNLSIAERMQWYAKIAARMMMCKSNNKSEEVEVNPETSWNETEESDDKEQAEDDVMEDDSDPISRCKLKTQPVWGAGHREYRVWHIGKESQNHLMKNQAGEIKLLVRTKYDGLWSRRKNSQKFTVAPKLDYQYEYGGDCLTLSECVRQWTDLHIRPGSMLKRARINPLTCEFMQLQTLVEADLSVELQSTYNINASSIANRLYSVTSRLAQLPYGNYVMEHSEKSGAFCLLHMESDINTPGSFELQKRYPSQAAETVPRPVRAPFIPLDPNFKTSNCCYRSVLPLTFPPRARQKPALLLQVPNKYSRKRARRNKKRIQQILKDQ